MDFSKYLGLEVGWQFLFFFHLVFEFLDVVAIVAIENLFEDETKKISCEVISASSVLFFHSKLVGQCSCFETSFEEKQKEISERSRKGWAQN